jgi:hypothetical protein
MGSLRVSSLIDYLSAKLTVRGNYTTENAPPAPATCSASQDSDAGYAYEDTVQYRIYAYVASGSGIKLISSTYCQTSEEVMTDEDRVMSVSWTASSGADGYYVLRNYNGSGWDSYYLDNSSADAFDDYNDVYAAVYGDYTDFEAFMNKIRLGSKKGDKDLHDVLESIAIALREPK